jgi:hypothetical protein
MYYPLKINKGDTMRSYFLCLLILTVIPVSVLAYVNVSSTGDDIAGTYQNSIVNVSTDEDPVYALIFYQGMDLWVKIIGQKGDMLAEYDLGKGNLVELSGGGDFTLQIYSKNGTGHWEGQFFNKADLLEEYPDALNQ